MTPIEIKSTITEMSDTKLAEKINYLSYTFCVNADFSKTEAIAKLINQLEMYVLEGTLRVIENTIGHRPYQNKIYEKVENVFGVQDAYNINRMISSLRRTKMVAIDVENTKYIAWMKNRIKYGVKTIMADMKTTSKSTSEVC